MMSKSKQEQVLEVLKIADRNFDSPEKWTHRASARDTKKVPVYYDSKDAVAWDLGGMIRKSLKEWEEAKLKPNQFGEIFLDPCEEEIHYEDVVAAFRFEERDCDHIITWNDEPGRTFQEVKELLKNTIRQLSPKSKKSLKERTVEIIEKGGRILLRRDKDRAYLDALTNMSSGPDYATWTYDNKLALVFFNLKWAFTIAKLYGVKVVVVYPKKSKKS